MFLKNIFLAETDKNVTDVIDDMKSCEESKIMDAKLGKNFTTETYDLRIYTAGMYYFDSVGESWEGKGISLTNTTKLMTAAKTNHLTSFATGFFPVPNTIDFEFVFANNCNDTDEENYHYNANNNNCFMDNMTIFLLLIISFTFYFIGMKVYLSA